MNPYVYIVVRTDIPIEQQLVQVAHASLESAYDFGRPPNEDVYTVLLQVADEEELLDVYERITDKGIESHLFYEPDDNIGCSALATEPLTEKSRRKIMYPYKLWKQS